ncbi:unnamed protein product [Durusdinium trenchii]|uniref:Pinin_SDK_memA domain-containing protein n=2 Tax=Durusdinium trenchii TaxID=1381693 RepID=A0ABP0J859_9DINO
MAFRRLGLPLRGEEEERPPKIRKVAEKEATSGEAEANGNRSERGKADRKANIVAASAVGVKAKVAKVGPARPQLRPQLRPRQDIELQEKRPNRGNLNERGRNLLGSMLIHLASRRRLQVDQPSKPKLSRPEEAKAFKAVKDGDERRDKDKQMEPTRPKLTEKPKPQKPESKPPKPRPSTASASGAAPEKESLELRLAEHYGNMMNFIRTRAEPILFYLPAHHTPETQKCLEETQETINRKIQVLATHFQTGGAQADAEESENEDQDADANDSNAGLVANSHRRAALTPAKT